MAGAYGRKRGRERPKSEEKNVKSKQFKKKNGRMEHKLACSPAPSSSPEISSEEEEPRRSVASEELVVHREPSIYNNLLNTLGKGSGSFANFYKNRQRDEAGISHSDEDEDDDDENGTAEVKEESEEGSDGESDQSDSMEADVQEPTQSNSMKENEEEDESENNGEASATDQEDDDDLEVNGETDIDSSVVSSSFNLHLGHILSTDEVAGLTEKQWKYKWKVPAVGSSTAIWIGTGECLQEEVDDSSCYGLKPKLFKHWLDLYKTSGGNDFHSSRQRLFFTLCTNYRDIFHCNKKPFYLKGGQEEDSSIMDSYIIHALNHVFKTRDFVTKNEAKLAKHPENVREEVVNSEKYLDHGFTRPKVLIVLPYASIALRVVKRLITLTPSSHKVNVEYTDRFLKEFDTAENDVSEDVHDGERLKIRKSSKPSDYKALFGGINNDLFMLGIKFTRRSIKLYSDFYSSDIIVASPLGLVNKIEAAQINKEKDVDYLSSIEVLIVDYADVIYMQNWAHLNTVVEKLNQIPAKQHGTDVMRIRKWYLDGYAKFYRQTILLGSFPNPEINSLFNQLCVNYQGKVKSVTEYKGVLPKVLLQVRQMYERFDVTSIAEAADARFDYFTKKVFPKIKDSLQGGTMLFISSYFEYVRVRNFMQSQNASFCMISEYTKQSDISRARIWFFEGKQKIMLYTERAHFYHRYKIRGIRNLIIYSLPERKEFYPELVNMIEESDNRNCTVLFSRLDQLRLERIIGSTSTKRLTSSEKNLFVFC